MSIERDCSECGKPFSVDTDQRNWQHVKFCSGECQTGYTLRRRRERYVKQTWPQKRRCTWCSNDFLVHKSGGKPQKYCSRACYLAKKKEDQEQIYEASRTPKVCMNCGEPFFPAKYAAAKQIYCSNKCYISAAFKKHGYKHRRSNVSIVAFRKAKPGVLERDGHKCVLCGSAKRLHVHHLDGAGRAEAADNTPENLMTLCGDCHHAMHRVNLVKIDGKWMVQGRAFDLLALSGEMLIHHLP